MPPITAVIILYGLGLTASMQVGLIGPIAPDLRASFGLSQAEFGLVASLITAAGALCAIPAGVWAARAGLRRSLVLGCMMMIAGALIFATASVSSLLYVGRIVTSVGYLLIVVGAPSWMAAFTNPKLVAMAMSIWGTFIPVGIALGNWVSAAAVTWMDWRIAVGVCTLPVLVLLPLLIPRQRFSFAPESRFPTAAEDASTKSANSVEDHKNIEKQDCKKWVHGPILTSKRD